MSQRGALLLVLSSDGNRLRVEAREAARSGHDEVSERRFDRKDRAAIDALTAELDLVMARATRWGDEDQGSAAMARQSCELLFDTFWPQTVKALLRAWTGPLTVVIGRADPLCAWLEAIPFELMHDGQGLLGERLGLARDSERTLEGGERAVTTHRGAGRALVVCDPRGDLIGAYHEGLAVRDELSALGFDVDLRSTEVTALDVLRLLRDYALVHFAGHGERPASERGGSARGWWLKDEVLSAAMLAELAGGRPLPELVFSNACRSLARGEGDAGLAAAMLMAGTKHLVGTTREVPDEVAALFALAFYERVGAGVTIGEAVREARLHLRERYGPGSLYGGAWVLYGDPCAVVKVGERADEPVAAAPLMEAGLRLRGAGAMSAVASGGGGATAPIGATKGQALLAGVGALALIALLVGLIVSAVSGSNAPTPSAAEGVKAPSLEGPILRAHPVEHWPVAPLWGPPGE